MEFLHSTNYIKYGVTLIIMSVINVVVGDLIIASMCP